MSVLSDFSYLFAVMTVPDGGAHCSAQHECYVFQTQSRFPKAPKKDLEQYDPLLGPPIRPADHCRRMRQELGGVEHPARATPRRWRPACRLRGRSRYGHVRF